jgi:hypothetical protein
MMRRVVLVFPSYSFSSLILLGPFVTHYAALVEIARQELYRMLQLHPYNLAMYDPLINKAYLLLDEVTQFIQLPYYNTYAIRQMAGVLNVVLARRGFPCTQNIWMFLNRLGA